MAQGILVLMTIAIFGGRFDPIHNGHLAVAKEVLRTGYAEKVLFSVENQHQWRPIVASAKDRIAMVNLAIENDPHFGVDDTPIQLGGLTETISVMRELRKKIHDEIFFVVGSDQPFQKWTHWDELEKEVTFFVIERKNYQMNYLPPNATFINDPTYEPLEDSATRIREYLKLGKSISGLVPKEVEEYIYKKGLYK